MCTGAVYFSLTEPKISTFEEWRGIESHSERALLVLNNCFQQKVYFVKHVRELEIFVIWSYMEISKLIPKDF